MRIIGLFLVVISISVLANETTEVSNVKCKGGWITSGTSKLEVVSYCGEPRYQDITSGENMVKSEDLLYTINRKEYIISFRNGKVVNIGWVK
jgi:hypothetical protein